MGEKGVPKGRRKGVVGCILTPPETVSRSSKRAGYRVTFHVPATEKQVKGEDSAPGEEVPRARRNQCFRED